MIRLVLEENEADASENRGKWAGEEALERSVRTADFVPTSRLSRGA